GRLDPGQIPAARPIEKPQARRRMPWLRDLATTAVVIGAVVALHLFSVRQWSVAPPPPLHDVYASANLRDLRFALDLYARENGHSPARIDELVEGRWLAPDQAIFEGYALRYQRDAGGMRYELALERH